MGVDVSGHETMQAALQGRQIAQARGILPRVQVVREQEPLRIPVTVTMDEAHLTWRWTCIGEDGFRQSGSLVPHSLECTAQRTLRGVRWCQYAWPAPFSLGIGYHNVRIEAGTRGIPAPGMRLIVTPERCYESPALVNEGRIWGISLQLYALRSERNWGIGDFEDLAGAIDVLAQHGVSIIGLNPLHALYLTEPLRASPYSPSSRRFLNPLYLNVEAMSDFAECEPVRRDVARQAFQAHLAFLRDQQSVDYSAVAAVKLPVLERLYRHFREQHLAYDSARARDFRAFQAAGGAALRQFSAYEVLAKGGARPPARAADSASACELLTRIAGERRCRVEFYEYLQWQTTTQLARAAARGAAHGMTIGLYRDLAVGVTADGADAWIDAAVLCRGVSIGAPPDDFSPAGQIWGLLPPAPSKLEDLQYAPFIDTLRASMRHAGALRVDHILGFLRLFWVPEGACAVDGAYVRYSLDDLLGILALESVRNRCLIVGEDLGTVPDELRAAIHGRGVLSCRVLLFERHWDAGGSFRQPHEYPRQALVTVTTHDLPTLLGFVAGRDLAVRRDLGQFPDDDGYAEQRTRRDEECRMLGDALARQDLAHDLRIDSDRPALAEETMLAAHRFIARTPARIMLAQMEDVLGEADQVNLPGTIDEYPNWRRKLPLSLERWCGHAPLVRLARALAEERPSSIEPNEQD
ncbi:MAG: 4-alpha-glucanotransferase [Gammaproteobacteria bacterium]